MIPRTQEPKGTAIQPTSNFIFHPGLRKTMNISLLQKTWPNPKKGNVPRPLFLFGFYPFIVPSSKAWPVQRDNLKNAPANSVECKTWLSHLVFKLNQSCYSLDTWQHIDANMYKVYVCTHGVSGRCVAQLRSITGDHMKYHDNNYQKHVPKVINISDTQKMQKEVIPNIKLQTPNFHLPWLFPWHSYIAFYRNCFLIL